MSTKIYNGYRISVGERGMAGRLREVRESLGVTRTRLYRTLVVGAACALVDATRLGEDPRIDGRRVSLDGSALGSAARVIDELIERAEASARRDPEFDLGVSLTLVWGDDGQLYGLLYCERQEFVDAFTALDGVEAWPYWDNTEGPEDVSDEEWHERGATWNRLLGGGAPAEVGVTWSLNGARDAGRAWFLDERATIEEYIPERDARARGLARSIALREMAEERLDNLDGRTAQEVFQVLLDELPTRLAREERIAEDLELADLSARDLLARA